MSGPLGKMLAVILCAVLISVASGGTWHTMCSGQSSNRVRGCDSFGCGSYNAKRGSRLHKGVDVVCSDGSKVYAPFSGTLDGAARPYGNTNAIDDGVKMSGGGNCIKLFYVKPAKYRGTINKGDVIGTLLPMQTVYKGITSHLHVQNCDLTNPTSNL